MRTLLRWLAAPLLPGLLLVGSSVPARAATRAARSHWSVEGRVASAGDFAAQGENSLGRRDNSPGGIWVSFDSTTAFDVGVSYETSRGLYLGLSLQQARVDFGGEEIVTGGASFPLGDATFQATRLSVLWDVLTAIDKEGLFDPGAHRKNALRVGLTVGGGRAVNVRVAQEGRNNFGVQDIRPGRETLRGFEATWERRLGHSGWTSGIDLALMAGQHSLMEIVTGPGATYASAGVEYSQAIIQAGVAYRF